MVTQKDHMAGVLANTLLYSEGAQEGLIRLVWDRFTDEQKQNLTDEAYNVALARIGCVVEGRIFGVGSRPMDSRPNLFARHIEAAVKRSFESEGVQSMVKALIDEHITEAKSGLRATISKITGSMTTTLIKNIVERVDTSTLRDALRASVSSVKEEVGE